MSYKNTVKLFASNFTLVWKQLLYLFVCGILFGVCAYLAGKPIIDLLYSSNVVHEAKVFVETAYTSPSEIALKLSDLFKHALTVLFVENFSSIWLTFFALIILCIFLPYVLIQISYFNITSILYQKLSMNMNVGYFQNGLKVLGKGIIYALTNILFGLPFLALNILLLVIYLTLAKTILSSIIGLVIVSIFMILIRSVKYSLFTCYTCIMVEDTSNPFVAFGKGFALTIKRFWRILSCSIAVTLTLIFINFFISLFTFFAGTIISVPASFVFLSIFYLVIYFNTKGERYYLGPNLIFNPTKYTIKQDEVTVIEIPKPPKQSPEIEDNKETKKKTKKTKSTKNIQNNKD